MNEKIPNKKQEDNAGSSETKKRNPNRREFVGLASASFAAGPSAISSSFDALAGTDGKPEGERPHVMEGKWILVEDLMSEEAPMPDWESLLNGAQRGLIIGKDSHRFWLFEEGQLIKTGPVGTASVRNDYSTPEGAFHVTREEGENYTSREYPSPEPNMPWAVFFHNRGIAIHGSLNFQELAGERYLLVDNSHGCANATVEDAKLVNDTLRAGDPVVVLP